MEKGERGEGRGRGERGEGRGERGEGRGERGEGRGERGGRSEIDREYLKDPRRANSNDENGEEGRGILLSRNRRYDEGGECGSRNNPKQIPTKNLMKMVW